MIRVIVYDFDGVVVRRSEKIKEEAWMRVFRTQDELKAFSVAEERFGRGRGGDRYDILRATYEALLYPEDEVAARVAEGGRAFDVFVRAAIVKEGVQVKDHLLIQELAGMYSQYLNSATPEDSLVETVKGLGIDDVFAERAFGRPSTKAENFSRIIAAERCEPQDMLFIGDSASDLRVAQVVGCRFLAFENGFSSWVEGLTPTITDIAQVSSYIDNCVIPCG